MEGWIKLHRKLLNSDIWRCEEFTRGQAWVDLLLLANHKEGYIYKRGIKVSIERGQVARSEVELSERWRWSRTKVNSFLKELVKEQQIELIKSNVLQVIKIQNYDMFQDEKAADYTTEKQQTEQQTIQQNEQQTIQQKSIYKNDKNNNISPNARMCEGLDLDECYNALLNRPLWIENVLRVNRITLEQFTEYLKQFFDELRCRGETYKSEDDAKFHFHSWLKIKLEKQQKKQNGTIRNRTGTQQGNDNGNVTVREVKL